MVNRKVTRPLPAEKAEVGADDNLSCLHLAIIAAMDLYNALKKRVILAYLWIVAESSFFDLTHWDCSESFYSLSDVTVRKCKEGSSCVLWVLWSSVIFECFKQEMQIGLVYLQLLII